MTNSVVPMPKALYALTAGAFGRRGVAGVDMGTPVEWSPA